MDWTDFLQNTVFKFAHSRLSALLSTLVSSIVVHGHLPQSMNESLIVSIILALRLELVRPYQAAGDYSLCESVLLSVCDFGSAPPTPGGNESQLA